MQNATESVCCGNDAMMRSSFTPKGKGKNRFDLQRKSRFALLALLLSALLITVASAAIYYQITATMTIRVGWSPVVFIDGADTGTCGGDTTTNNVSASFTSVWLCIASNITITQLANVTNSDSNPHDVTVNVSSSDFGSALNLLLLYLVSPSGSETLVVKMDNSGNVVTEGVPVTIPAGEEWAVKLVGCYDIGIPQSQTNQMTLSIEVK